MHHACAQQLDPALAVAGGADLTVHLAGAVALVALHVHLAGGLGEGEVVGTEAHLAVLAVDLLHNGDQSALQVTHGDVLVHHQTLDLVEHGGVGGVGLVLAEHTAGSQHAQGGLVLLHVADLHGAGLGAQQNGIVVGEVEGVGAVTAGVALLDVQAGEVVAGQLHLGAVHHLIAQAHEDLLDLLEHHVHGVLMAQLHGIAGDGDIDGLGGQFCLQNGGIDGGLALLELVFDLGTDGVGQLAHDGALLGAELAHHLQDGGQLALLAKPLDALLIQSRRSLGGLQSLQRAELDCFQLLFHGFVLSFWKCNFRLFAAEKRICRGEPRSPAAPKGRDRADALRQPGDRGSPLQGIFNGVGERKNGLPSP